MSSRNPDISGYPGSVQLHMGVNFIQPAKTLHEERKTKNYIFYDCVNINACL